MTFVSILVPVLDRPHRVAPLVHSIRATTPGRYEIVFVTDSHDQATRDAITAAGGCTVLSSGGSYARKINDAIRATTSPYVFLGADDLVFLPGWFDEAYAVMSSEGVGVVGVNDLIERDREHATHFLMSREYAQTPTIDSQPGPLFEGYHHWFVDDELIATAKRRDAYAYAPDAQVQHQHPMNGLAVDDDTYRRGRERARVDRRTFRRRSRLWM